MFPGAVAQGDGESVPSLGARACPYTHISALLITNIYLPLIEDDPSDLIYPRYLSYYYYSIFTCDTFLPEERGSIFLKPAKPFREQAKLAQAPAGEYTGLAPGEAGEAGTAGVPVEPGACEAHEACAIPLGEAVLRRRALPECGRCRSPAAAWRSRRGLRTTPAGGSVGNDKDGLGAW